MIGHQIKNVSHKLHVPLKLMLYYSSIVKVTDAHIPVYMSHACTPWMNQMFIHTLLVYCYCYYRFTKKQKELIGE